MILIFSKCTIQVVLSLFDIIIQENDEIFILFFLVAFLTKYQTKIFEKDYSQIPSILSTLCVTSIEEVHEIYIQACEIRDKTPFSFRLYIDSIGVFNQKNKNKKTLEHTEKLTIMPIFPSEILYLTYNDIIYCPNQDCANFIKTETEVFKRYETKNSIFIDRDDTEFKNMLNEHIDEVEDLNCIRRDSLAISTKLSSGFNKDQVKSCYYCNFLNDYNNNISRLQSLRYSNGNELPVEQLNLESSIDDQTFDSNNINSKIYKERKLSLLSSKDNKLSFMSRDRKKINYLILDLRMYNLESSTEENKSGELPRTISATQDELNDDNVGAFIYIYIYI